MAKKKRQVFRASALTSPMSPEVGVMNGEQEPPSLSEGRLERLKELMQQQGKYQQETAQQKKSQERIDKMFPNAREMVLDRSQLIPAPKEWNFFGKPKPDQYALIVQSIYEYGLWHPLTVWERDNGKYMILGGHTRASALADLQALTGDDKYQMVPCKVYGKNDISEAVARRIIILTNVAQRASEKPATRVQCFAEMARLEKKEAFYGSKIDVASSVARQFNVSRRQVFTYLSLQHLYPPLLDCISNRTLTIAHGSAISKLSADVQKYLYEKGYYSRLNAQTIRSIAKARNFAEIDHIVENMGKEKRYIYRFESSVKRPRSSVLVPLFVQNGEDLKHIRSLIHQALDTAEGHELSASTRKKIAEALDKSTVLVEEKTKE